MLRRGLSLRLVVGLALVVVAPAVATACERGRAAPELSGSRLEVLATWADAEAERFDAVLTAFERDTGAQVVLRSAGSRLPEQLLARVAEGDPPDVAVLPQPGLLAELAERRALVPLADSTARQVRRSIPPAFVDLAAWDGVLYGVWFKAANKSLVWYDVATFERQGLVPPDDLGGLVALVDRLAAAGVPAFAVAGASGWTLTDWFENAFLALAGPDAYDALAQRRLPWTAPEVVRTLRYLDRLLGPGAVLAGAEGAVRTDFAEAVRQVFGRPSAAAMVMEGDFVAGVITSSTPATLSVDADAFAFPAGPSGAPVVVAGGDVAVQLRPSAAGSALLRYLATPAAAEVWAREGGFVSPNVDVNPAAYPDDVTRGIASRLLEAGADARFDLSDLQPPAFGGSEDSGLFAELRTFLLERDPVATAARLEAVAQQLQGAPR